MKTHLLIAILLVGFTTQQCSIGCLMCSSLNQCVLCDITNSYFLNGNTCSLSLQTNCNVIGQNGACNVCNTNYYMDYNSQRCLSVSATNMVRSCLMYNSAQVCTSCFGEFFLFAGNCLPVNNTITNCQTYSANKQCTTCSTGFLISNDFSSCVAVPNNTNCLSYTYIGCGTCNSGFVNNPNYYFTNFNLPAYVNNNILLNLVSPSKRWLPLSVCQPVTVFNCQAYSAFNFCIQCNSGFYLLNGNCFAFPLPVIYGCLTYTSLVTCSACQPGMFMGQNVCLNNVVISNCLSFSGSASTTTCVQCNNGFYLQGNVCVNRTVSVNIQNCQTVSIKSDVCSVCSSGFILTTDGRGCLTAIANCNTYAASTFQTTALQCSLCSNSFYLSSSGSTTICISGSIQFCQTYSINSNTCTLCSNGYYLSNNLCNAQITINNCQTYDPLRVNYCSVCNSGFYNFAYTTVCVQTTVKTGCQSYSVDGNSCTACNVGYYLNSGNCNIIPSTFANCMTFSGTLCTFCNTGYMINTLPTVGTCTLPLDYMNSTISSPCSVMASVGSGVTPTWTGTPTTSQTPLTCSTCNSYMYGYTPQGAEAICVNFNQLTLYSSYTAVTQCSRYGLNYASTQIIVCMQCSSGYFISGYQALAQITTATSCVSTCTSSFTTSNAVIPDDFLGFVNICVPSVVTDAVRLSGTCQRFGRTGSQNTGVTAATATNGLVGNDFKCFISAPSSSNTLPTNYLRMPSPTLTSFYTYEAYSSTTPLTLSSDYLMGYSNTVDSNSLFPTVFNYHGIMSTITDGNTVGGILAATLNFNNLNNCDIIINWAATYPLAGFAFYNNDADFKDVTNANPYYSCFRCNFGYQLSYAASNRLTNPSFPSCVQMTNCASSTTVYGGLPTFLNSVFSCHLCSPLSGSTTYPSIYMESAKTNGVFTGWSIQSVYATGGASIQTANHGFRCAAAPTSIVISDTPTTTANSVANCAAYGYITVINTPAAANTLAIMFGTGQRNTCLACAANYYPNYFSGTTIPATADTNSFLATTFLPAWIVASCAASANCDTSVISQFNSCGKCRTDLVNAAVPAYYAFMDFTLTNCYQAYSANCFILVSSGFSNTANNNVCDTCMAGYFLNADKVCELYQVPNQSTSNSVFVNAWYAFKVYAGTTTFTIPTITTIDPVYIRKHYLLSYKQLQYGVSSCTSGWVQAPANLWAPRVCVWSSYVYNTTGSYPTGSFFINNCVKYNLTQSNSNNVCGGCNVGYIPTIDGISCVTTTGLPNCNFAQTGSNSGLCYQCSTSFYNVNGQCVSSTIANCAAYVNTLWSYSTPATLQCATCLNGFYLSNDYLSCTAGSVVNCMTYTQGQSLQCTACAAGFVLMSLTSVYYCYPIPSALNCVSLQDTSSTSGINFATISCANCIANTLQVFGSRTWSSLGLTTQAQTLCMPFTVISNCLVYDQANSIIKSNTFTCLQCNSGFWFSSANITCVQRFNLPSQCSNYSLTSDACLNCSSGSFLTANGRQCIDFPNGIYQCNQYSAATVCIQCNTGYYLLNNACVASVIINNCNVYGGNYTCSSCIAGYFLTNSTSCVIATATNCLTYNSINVCASCNSIFGLQTINGVTSCVLVSLPNCLNATNIAPFTCITCATGYFPNTNGVCVAVPYPIANCLVSDTALTCLTCAANSVLNVARTVCNSTFYTSYIDPNCGRSYLSNSPICTQCSLGWFFGNGTCNSCSGNTLASGCLSCNPLNNNVCLVCRPTFYMNSNGGCVAINLTPSSPGKANNTSATATITTTVALSLALVSLLV